MRPERKAYTHLSQPSIQPLLDDFDSKEESPKVSSSFNSANSSSILLPLHIAERKRSSALVRLYRTPISTLGLTSGIIFGFVLVILFIRTSLHPQPSYNLLSKSRYQETLSESIHSSFPIEIQDELRAQLLLSLSPSNLSSTSDSPSDFTYSPRNDLPKTFWQTDKALPPVIPETIELKESWERAGVDQTIFLDDAGAVEMMKKLYNDSEVFNTYMSLPAPVLKADMLRYSLLLSRGGIYSDVDTKALMPIEDWKRGSRLWIGQGTGSIRLPHTLDRIASMSMSRWELIQKASPVRIIISIEGSNNEWDTLGNFLRWAGLKIFTRHREVQFVQWTIQSSSFHPILLDTVRRIIDTNQIAKGMMIEKDIKINRAESSGDFEKAKKIRKQDFPWDGVKGKEFEATGVEEYTGPGTWSDSVLSYLYAISDITLKDLHQLKHPLQVGDVLILPRHSGFNPSGREFRNSMARVGHLFRGSWK